MVIDALIKREYGIDFLVKSSNNIVCQCACDDSGIALL